MDFVSTAIFGPKDERTLDDFDPIDTVLRLPGVSTVSLDGYDWIEDSAKLKDAQGESKQLVQKIKVFDRELNAMKDQRDGERQKRVRAEYKCKLLEKMLATKELELEYVQGELETEKLKTEALKWRVAKAALAMSERPTAPAEGSATESA